MAVTPAKISLLGASFETNNMGVSALATAALTCINLACFKAEVSLVEYGRETRTYTLNIGDREVEVKLVNLRFSKKLYLPNNIAWLILLAGITRLLPFDFVRQTLMRRNPWLKHIQETQLFMAISGGDSFSDIYGLWRLLYAALPQILVLILRKRLVLLPQTIGPFRSRVARQIARFVLKRAELVFSRDYAGIDVAGKLVGARANTETIRFCNDVAFVLTPKAPAKVDLVGLPSTRHGRPVVGVNVNGLLAIGGYTRKNMFGLACDYNALVARLIELFVTKNACVMLVPHVFGTHEQSDSVACESAYIALRTKYGERLGLLRGTYNQHEIKHIIGSCDFFIGSRMHACIAAMSQAVPAVAIAYSDKFMGVMQTFGAESLVADARVLDEKQIVELVERTYDNRAAVQSLLQENIQGISTRVVREFSALLNETWRASVSDSVVLGPTT